MAPPIKHLRELNEKTKFFKDKVKVIEKWHATTGARGTRYQRIMMMDDEGTKMQSILFNDDIDAYENIISYNKEYYMSNALLKKTPEQYKMTSVDYQMIFGDRALIEPVEQANTQEISEYRSLSAIANYPYRDERFDIVAAVHYMEKEAKTVISRYSNRGSQVREIILIDQSWKTILLRAWNEFASEECANLTTIMKTRPENQVNRAGFGFTRSGWGEFGLENIRVNSGSGRVDRVRVGLGLSTFHDRVGFRSG